MITRVTAAGFMGGDFDQPLGKHTLILGPNGAGKSSRTNALMLAVNGAIPGGPKTNPDIYAAFGSGDDMTVGFEMDGYTFEREYTRKKDGSITQIYKVNGKKVSREFFQQEIGAKGKPRVIDLKDFIDLSDQKKIDAILNLFPPAENITPTVTAMEKEKLALNDATAKLKAQESVCATLQAQRAGMQLPATTLSAVTEEMQAITGIMAKARIDLAEAEKQEALEAQKKRDDERKAKEEIERAEKERLAEIRAKELEAANAKKQEDLKKKLAEKEAELEKAKAQKPAEVVVPAEKFMEQLDRASERATGSDAAASIQSIITAMEAAGCSACAARLVAKRELKKYTGGTHGQAAIG